MAHVRPQVKADVLQWARRCRSLPRKTAAERLQVSETKLAAWESGTEYPTIGQLRKMAQVYRKPFAMLFTDEPPEPLEDLPDLRRLFHVMRENGPGVAVLPPELAEAVGEVLARRDVYEELALSPPVFDIVVDPDAEFETIAEHLRSALGVSWDEQRACRAGNKARRFWTTHIEAAGALVFQFTAPLEQARGFSLAHHRHPIVAVNSGDAEFGRVFSLVHELVHVSLPAEHQLDPAECEQLCNGVAGRMLVPERCLAPLITPDMSRDWNDGVDSLSRDFGVSQDVIARRLRDTGRMSPQEYRLWLQRIVGPTTSRKSGGNYYATQKTQLGMPFITTVFEALEERRLTLAGAARAFQMKPLNVERFRDHVLKKRERSGESA